MTGDQPETSAAADQQRNWRSLVRTGARSAAFALIEHKEHTKYEAKEYDLPLV